MSIGGQRKTACVVIGKEHSVEGEAVAEVEGAVYLRS